MEKYDEIIEILKRIESKIDKLSGVKEGKKTTERWVPSPKQINLVFQIAKEKNISPEFLEEITQEVCGVRKIKDISTVDKLQKLINFLKQRD